jgi:hypothetical protein
VLAGCIVGARRKQSGQCDRKNNSKHWVQSFKSVVFPGLVRSGVILPAPLPGILSDPRLS